MSSQGQSPAVVEYGTSSSLMLLLLVLPPPALRCLCGAPVANAEV